MATPKPKGKPKRRSLLSIRLCFLALVIFFAAKITMGLLFSRLWSTFPTDTSEPSTFFDGGSDLPADVATNPTVFGMILRGEIPARFRGESKTLLSFRDIRPHAPTHNLIIPKHFINSVYDLTPSDLPLLREMKSMAEEQLQKEEPEAWKTGDYFLVFHVPPFNSVGHLHMHVLGNASAMSGMLYYGKYRQNSRWCISWDRVIERLEAGRPAVDFERPNRFFTNIWRKLPIK